MDAPEIIHSLVDRFDSSRDQYTSQSYNETQIRREFIDPFFSALGWDIDNKQGFAEGYKDVVHEDAIKVGSATKAPDYSFRIGGTRKFFVEAKKPAVNVKEDIAPAFQLRRYGWSAKLPLSILTDFDELAVYDCRIKPVKTDKSSAARIQYLTYKDYIPHWEEIYSVFSRDAVWKGSFDKYAVDKRGKKGTEEVDDAFLKEIESWRDILARNFALRNPKLTVRELNFAVQRTIDRIIFLRICEDRGIETYGALQALVNGERTYKRLCELFHRADEKYNSGLFHFSPEKGRPENPDELTLSLKIDDKVLKDILAELYYPDCPYEFSILPADILGQVYEQFLGKVIRLTAGHQAKVEEKPEIKKAGGVYYTPTYIVEYIVKNTVGKLVEGKTPKQVASLRILDPACGSGSFLIGAYQYLLDWHHDWYTKDSTDKWSTGKNATLYAGPGGAWRLTTAERKRILLNNIYGVDIDSQAVEVTKLSLLLKVLEGESDETINQQLKIFHERALPDLGSNIKCGNSLIAPDFFEGQLIVDPEERSRINAFDWDVEFKEIIVAGGFDAVIGNPPYVRQESLGQEFKIYAEKSFAVFHGVADLYTYFVERGVSLLRDGGMFGYIVANKWLRANYGEPLRRWVKSKGLMEIVDFGDLPVFSGATTYPCILRVRKGSTNASFGVTQVESLQFQDLQTYAAKIRFEVKTSTLDDSGWSLSNEATTALLNRLRGLGKPLGEYVNGKIYRGIITGLNEAFVIDEEKRKELIAEDGKSTELLRPFLAGRDIKRYQEPRLSRYLILMPNGWTHGNMPKGHEPWDWLRKKYPAISAHLSPFRTAAEKRWDRGEFWWELRPCDYYGEFEKPKIIFPDISTSGDFILDKSGRLFSANTTYFIPRGDPLLLAILNSSLLTFLYSHLSASIRGGYLRFFTQYLELVPIPSVVVSREDNEQFAGRGVQLVEQIQDSHRSLSKAKTDHEKTAINRQIDATDKQIDSLVYELYGLTEEEIRIVEGSLSLR